MELSNSALRCKAACPGITISSSSFYKTSKSQTHIKLAPSSVRLQHLRQVPRYSKEARQLGKSLSKRIWGTRVGARSSQMGPALGNIRGNGSRWSAGTWLDNRARVDAEIPLSDAWNLWNDRENVTRWMEWIDSVKVSKEKPEFSKWTLRYKAFGRDFEFSWLARNLEPIHHQKIHWRSVDGLPNRGAVRFLPRGPKACTVELTISYEVPDILAPLASTVAPVVERVLQQDLNRFAKYVKTNRLSRV